MTKSEGEKPRSSATAWMPSASPSISRKAPIGVSSHLDLLPAVGSRSRGTSGSGRAAGSPACAGCASTSSGSSTEVSRSSRDFTPSSISRGPLNVSDAAAGRAPQAQHGPARAQRARLVVEEGVVLEVALAHELGPRAPQPLPRRLGGGDLELDLGLPRLAHGPAQAPASTTRTFMSIRSFGLSRGSRGAFTIASATSIPRTTRPKALYCRSRKVESADADEELRAGAVRVLRARHRDDAPLVRGVVELGLDRVAGAAGAVARLRRPSLPSCWGSRPGS